MKDLAAIKDHELKKALTRLQEPITGKDKDLAAHANESAKAIIDAK
jgi:hypothetical protein